MTRTRTRQISLVLLLSLIGAVALAQGPGGNRGGPQSGQMQQNMHAAPPAGD